MWFPLRVTPHVILPDKHRNHIVRGKHAHREATPPRSILFNPRYRFPARSHRGFRREMHKVCLIRIRDFFECAI